MKEDLELVPERPGVYLFRNRAGTVIYVGKAVSLKNRLRSYFQTRGQLEKTRRMVKEADRFEFIVTESEAEALALECNLIKEYRPKYNIELKDDKSYPFLRITNEDFPRVMITRNLVRDGSRYYGPYPNVTAVREALHLLRKIFRFRSCSERALTPRSRPCLNAQIRQCLAPCSGEISPEEYRQMIKQLELFLEGNTKELVRRLTEEMKRAVDSLEFETAARLRDQLAAISAVQEQQRVTRALGPDQDVLAVGRHLDEVCAILFRTRGGKVVAEEHYFLAETEGLSDGEVLEAFMKQYYHQGRDIPGTILVSHQIPERELLSGWLSGLRGSKVTIRVPQRGHGRDLVRLALDNAAMKAEERHRRALRTQEKGRSLVLALQEALGLEHPPRIIECIDISHLGGEETVGSLVQFRDGQPFKKGYRIFKIRTAAPGDDYAAIREVVRRRLDHREQDQLPDLLLIDGGRGQLHAAEAALREEGSRVPALASLAKEEEEVFLPGRSASIKLPRHHPGLQLLQQARDEAHRFANYRREGLHKKKTRASILEEVPGIGKKRQVALLKHFGSLARIREAGLEELARVPGMNRAVAEELYRYLRQPDN